MFAGTHHFVTKYHQKDYIERFPVIFTVEENLDFNFFLNCSGIQGIFSIHFVQSNKE